MKTNASVERIHLGWQGLPLEAAAGWLHERFGENLKDVLIALPGARSGRLLEEELARRIGPKLSPPRIGTAGMLSDKLLELDGEPAGRLTRTLAWAGALKALDQKQLQRIAARPPAPDDLSAWWRLAEEVRGLFGEVAAEELDFGRIAENEALPASEGERLRWVALAAAQREMEAQLAAAGVTDPHLGRLEAIREKKVISVGHVVLVGVVEMNQLLRRALELCESPVSALVFAPEDEPEGFDEWGCLRSEAWIDRSVSLSLDHWRVADRPADQANAAVEEIASWKGQFSADQITVGLAGSDIGPFMRRGLAEHGVLARNAAGMPLSSTGPMRLMELVGQFLRSERFADLATLVRNPDFEKAIRRRDESLEPIALVNAYHNAHLPQLVDGSWLARSTSRSEQALRENLVRLWKACLEVLGPCWNQRATASEDSIGALRTLLEVVYGAEPLGSHEEAQRLELYALRKIASAFTEVEGLPVQLAPRSDVGVTLDLLRRMLRNEIVPPPAAREDKDTIEMLGWLELPLDNAPALIVVGYEDGQVPESVRGDAFLPNSLRSSLGLVDDQQRLARDLYATELLLRSRTKVCFITGRRSLAGDPKLPSRIVFHCPPDEVVPRVRRFLDGTAGATVTVEGSGLVAELPRRELDFELTRMRVTDFALYLRSPYEYYLRRVLQLKTLDDRARELDPLAFGILTHDVMQLFGEDRRIREETDPKKISNFLCGELRSLARESYGERPLPAVRLQLEQLEHRLRAFAGKQAEHRASGWQILASEWSPEPGSVTIDVDGEPIELRGQIDRIDHHPERKAYAIWDYKTGDTVKAPGTTHRRKNGEWRDLQLPLYCILAAQLIGEEPPQKLGYIPICKDTKMIGFSFVKSWGEKKQADSGYEDGISAAYEAALEVIRAIRKESFFDPEGFDPRDEILRAIGGLGLIEDVEEESEGEEA